MILIISKNDKIIGADEEFLQNTSLENLKLNFPSMDLFTLQTSENNFEFTYNDINYFVQKYKVYTDIEEGNIFIFSKENKQIQNINISQPIQAEENKEIKKEISILPEESENNDLDLNLDSTQTDSKPEENELDLNLSFDSQPEQSENNDLDLNLDSTPTDSKPEENELDLNLSFDSQPEQSENNDLDLNLDSTPTDSKPEENELDLGLSSNEEDNNNNETISITEDDIKKDLNQASSDLGIDNETINQLFEDFKQQIKDEKNIFQKAIAEMDYDTLHKSAHKLKGVAFNLRLLKFGDLFKNIDDLAKSQADMREIETVINNLYSIIKEDNKINTINSLDNEKINFINPPENQEEKDIILKSIQISLEELKNKSEEEIKSNLKYLTNIIKSDNLSNINSSSKEELLNIIDLLIQSIKKEL